MGTIYDEHMHQVDNDTTAMVARYEETDSLLPLSGHPRFRNQTFRNRFEILHPSHARKRPSSLLFQPTNIRYTYLIMKQKGGIVLHLMKSISNWLKLADKFYMLWNGLNLFALHC